jgi:hypothetical protein
MKSENLQQATAAELEAEAKAKTASAGNNGGGSVPQIVASAASEPDPFNPDRLRLGQDFAGGLGVKRVLTTIPVKKPVKEWWIQVHPDESYRIQTCVLELKEDREIYLVDPELWPLLAAESTFGPRALFTGINRQGVLFVWPIRLPGHDGRIDDWNRWRWKRRSEAKAAGFV